MTQKKLDMQDVFLKFLRDHKTPVTIYLASGVQLKGIISWYDTFSVILRRDAHVQLIYKHAISTMTPSVPIPLFETAEMDIESSESHMDDR